MKKVMLAAALLLSLSGCHLHDYRYVMVLESNTKHLQKGELVRLLTTYQKGDTVSIYEHGWYHTNNTGEHGQKVATGLVWSAN